ncbi:hypothetical protein B0H13DRAFT_2408019 [Mycena leptocephala]|nr:hypothetical protein B0H13DRAFT_2408019 [Mycena leptocephala]
MVNTLQSYFHKGTETQNSSTGSTIARVVSSTKRNYCKMPEGGQSFRDACQRTVSVRSDKITWITHILGGKNSKVCVHVTDAARQEATSQRDAGFAEEQKAKVAAAETSRNMTTVFGTSTTSAGKHGRSVSAADNPEPNRLKQGVFQVFSGKDQPSTTAEAAELQAQALRATVSAGLPFRVWENREVQKLIGLLRSAGPEILPSRKVVAGRLLDDAAEKVEVQVKRALQGKEAGLVSDGWKAQKNIDVNALCANVDYKVYTLELVDMTALSKDGPALCKQFADMIARVEAEYKCYIIFFMTDADGGSKRGGHFWGRNGRGYLSPLVGHTRSVLLGVLYQYSCRTLQQFQLILGDYFKVYPYAAEIAETATGLIAWINNHGKVRKIFDGVQAELSKDRLGHVLVLAYLVANLTRWTTHCIAFLRLLVLREYLQFAVMQSRGAIIAVQVGAAKSTEGERLKEAIHYCDLISDPAFWSGLTSVVEDIEPICYGTNINQKDNTRADQVLLITRGRCSGDQVK